MGDATAFVTHLIRAFEHEEHSGFFLEIFLSIIALHLEELDKESTKINKIRLSNILKIIEREGVLARTIDIFIDTPSMKISQRASHLITAILEVNNSKKDILHPAEIQQAILLYIKQNHRFEGLFKKIQKAFETCEGKLKQRERYQADSVYDDSLFLKNLNIGHIIDTMELVDNYSYTNDLLQLIALLSSNTCTSFQVIYKI